MNPLPVLVFEILFVASDYILDYPTHLPACSLEYLKKLEKYTELEDIRYVMEIGFKELFKENNIIVHHKQLIFMPSLRFLDITYIDFFDCNLYNVDSIELLTNLEYLYLQYNHIKQLPKRFYRLKRLKHMDMQDNIMQKLPYRIERMNIEDLGLEYNELEDIDLLGRMKHLKSLYINHNGIKRLPDFESELYHLHIDNNLLESLPESLCNLPIKSLNINNNRITYLPKNIGDMKDLGFLHMSGNLIKSLPSSFIKLENLEYICLDNIDSEDYYSDATETVNIYGIENISSKLLQIGYRFLDI